MKKDTMKKKNNDNSRLQNYFALMAIVPAVLSIMVYELYDWLHAMYSPAYREVYDPITGIGILVPMAFMLEAFMFMFSHTMLKRMNRLIDGIDRVSNGDYSVSIDEKHMAPFTEVTEDFNKMTRELASVETLRSDFINNFSHEFKTPIVSINGFANLLLDSEVDEEERKQYLQIIADESKRLSTLSEQTILLSKLDTQTTIHDKQSYSLDEQVKQSIILLSKEWSSKNIDMDFDIQPVTYYGNPSIMQHIWINLINNSIKYTPENGSIRVSLNKEGSNIVFRVKDTGQGMNDEQIRHIFDKYYQVDKSHSSKGLGLGLAITKRAVELAHGTINVESEPEKGSTFIVTLPERTDD